MEAGARKYNRWTEEEVDFLNRNYQKLSCHEICVILGRNANDVIKKRHLEKIGRKNKDIIPNPVKTEITKRTLIGTPDWSDITEEELLAGYIPPTLDELSFKEKYL